MREVTKHVPKQNERTSLCMCERKTEAECHPDICQGLLCICLCARVSVSVHKASTTTLRVTLQLCHMMNTQQKCHPHSNYNTSMASCPTVMRGERVWMCACVHAYVCVSSKQRQHHLSDPVTVCVSVQDAKAAGTQRCKPQLAAWLSRLTVYFYSTVSLKPHK